MTETVTIQVDFNVAKRMIHYTGKCAQLHGYRHTLEASFTSNAAPGDIVVDFHLLHEKLGQWIDEYWDHNAILNKEDKLLGDAIMSATGQIVFYLEGDPTAERLALYVKDTLCPTLFPEASCISVRIYDDTHSWVEIT